MNPFLKMLKWDFLLQIRYKLIHIALLSIIIYFLATEAIPNANTPEMHLLAFFLDPTLIGIMFIGALILFEKSENTLQSLIVTPMKTDTYLLSKLTSLTALALLSTTVLVIPLYIFDNVTFNYGVLYLAVVLTTLMLLNLGLTIVAGIDSINEYLLTFMLLFLTLLIPPFLHITGLYQNNIFYAWPTLASLTLLEGAIEQIETWKIAYGITYQLLWIGILYYLARKAFHKHIVLKGA